MKVHVMPIEEVAAILAGLRLLQLKLTAVMDAEPEEPGGTTYGAHFEIDGTPEEEAVNEVLLPNGGCLSPEYIESICQDIAFGTLQIEW